MAPIAPDSQIAVRIPRGACRLASIGLLAEGPGRVEAVDDEQAMNIATANTGK